MTSTEVLEDGFQRICGWAYPTVGGLTLEELAYLPTASPTPLPGWCGT